MIHIDRPIDSQRLYPLGSSGGVGPVIRAPLSAKLPKPLARLVLLALLLAGTNSYATGAVAVLGAENATWNADVVSKVRANGSFSRVDSILVNVTFPSLATLQQYSAVLVYSDYRFTDPDTLGNNLASYVDGGGTVVVAYYALPLPPGEPPALGGTFASGGYLPVAYGGSAAPSRASLVADVPGSPLLGGVTSFTGGAGYLTANLEVVNGATQVAHLSGPGGTPLVVYKGSVVALNFYPPSSDAEQDSWASSTSGGRLLANALAWIGPKPASIITSPLTQQVPAGTNVNLSVVAAGASPLAYQWYLNGSAVAGATAADYSIPGVTANHAGNYSVIVTNSFGSATSSVAGLTVLTPLAGSVVTRGQPASLSAGAGPGLGSCQWLKDGVLLAGQTNSQLSFASFQFTNSGSYQVVLSNALGLNLSVPVLWSVPNAPLRAWGLNGSGQLGDGTLASATRPFVLSNNVVAMAAGAYHSLYVTANGQLWAMGGNSYGQLGNGNTTDQHTPVFVASNVVAVAAGAYHSLYLTANGQLWAMGNNNGAMLGIGSTDWNAHATPTLVATNVVSMAAGYVHSLYLTANGQLWGLGLHILGQWVQYTPALVATNVVSLAAGAYHSLYVTANGQLWAMGDNGNGTANAYGLLGNGNTTEQPLPIFVATNVVATAAGQNHSLYLTANGQLWAMGRNTNGQLGNGGADANAHATPAVVATNVVSLAAGGSHSLYVTANGQLWAMGGNSYGQLGNNTANDSHVPVLVNGGGLITASLAKGYFADHSLAVATLEPLSLTSPVSLTLPPGQSATFSTSVSNGDAPFSYQWYFNGNAISDATNANYSLTSTTNSAGNYTVVVGNAGGSVTSSAASLTLLAVTVNSAATCGPGSTVLTATSNVETPRYNWGGVITAVATSGSHSLCLKPDGSLWAMGWNIVGQLGNGNTTDQSTPVPIVGSGVAAIAAGGNHSLYLKTNGSLWAMGGNYSGQLGNGNTTDQPTPVPIVGSGVTAVAAGGSHSLYLKTDGSLWAMGFNGFGRLGNGNTTDQPTPVRIVASGVTAIAAGSYHSLYLKTDGSLWAMGYNSNGQLGNGNTTDQSTPVRIVVSGVTAVAAGDNHSLYLKTDGSLWAMGYNNFGELGNGNYADQHTPVQIVTSGVKAVAAGAQYSLYLKTDGSLWAMGYNINGQFGNGLSKTTYSSPVQIVASGVTAIAAGASGRSSYYLKTDGNLWAMGNNFSGQLGDGTTTERQTQVQVVLGSRTASLTVSPDVTTTYTVTVTDGVTGYVVSGSGTVTVNAPPDSTITSASAVCSGAAGNTASVADAGAGATYAWSSGNATLTSGPTTRTVGFTAGASGTVWLTNTVTTAAGCSATGNTTVTINPLPTVGVNSATTCGVAASILLASSSAASPTYLWAPGGATTAYITVSPAVTTAYTVTVTDGVTGCANSGSGTVTVHPLPTVSVSGSRTNCAGSQTTLAATSSADRPTYLWTPGEATTASVTVTPATTTTYSVTVTDGVTGCTNSGSGTVAVNSANQAPTDLALSGTSVNENQPSGTTVGTFSTTDPNCYDSFTYTLVSGTGGTDNAAFAVAGSTLQTAARFNYEVQPSYSIRVRTTDQDALHYEKVFTITVNNVTPEVFTVTTAADSGPGSFRQAILDGNACGDTVSILFNNGLGTITPGTALPAISAPATVNFGTGNTPLGLAVGSGGAVVTTGGSGSVVGPTTVSAGTLTVTDTSLATSAVTVNSGGVIQGSGTVGDLTLQSGGTVAPGASPGQLNAGTTVWEGGGIYEWQVNDATGTAGGNPGWDLLNTTGPLNVTATSGSKFTIKVVSLSGSSAGECGNFNNKQTYSWRIATASGGVSGFAADKFTLDTTGFANSRGAVGAFSLGQSGNDIYLNFTPVFATAAGYSRAWGTFTRFSESSLVSTYTTGNDARELVRVATGSGGTVPVVQIGGEIQLAPAHNNPETFEYVVRLAGYATSLATNIITLGVTNAVSSVAGIITTGSGSVTIKLAGVPGYAYLIQRASNLNGPWTDLDGSNSTPDSRHVAPASVVWTFTDTAPTNPAYYRLRQNN